MTQSFKHSLPIQKIVIRQDEDTESDIIETIVGQIYPLIRIKDHTIDFGMLDSFDLYIGNTLLPKIVFTFDDSDLKFRETNFIEKNDICTIYVGNAKDEEHEVINNDYLITNVMTSTSSDDVTIVAYLNVPELYKAPNRYFEGDSVSVLKTLAKECNLGFVSNVSSTLDSMNWIQSGTTMSFMQYIESNSRISNSTKMMIFIDQFANLNVVDVEAAIKSQSTTMLTTMPISGEKLNPAVKLVLSNNTQMNDEVKPIITSWSPNTNNGEMSMQWSSVATIKSLNTVDGETIVSDDVKKITDQLVKGSSWSYFENDNAYPTFAASRAINRHNDQLLQGIKLNLSLQYFVPVLYMFMSVPIEIWSIAKMHSDIVSQDPSVTNDNINEIKPTQPENTYEINKRFSGESLLLSMSLSYSRPTSRQFSRMNQSITVFIKNTN